MKKILLALSLLVSAFTMTAADGLMNYFTAGVNDTVVIPRSALGNDISVRVGAHFAAIVGRWHLTVTYPAGLTPLSVEDGSDLSVVYLNAQGEECVYNATVNTPDEMHTLLCNILVYAYYYTNNGVLASCGTAKWMAGDYDDMFTLNLHVAEDFEGGVITHNGMVASDNDPRGWNTLGGAMTYGEITFVLGNMKGDVNGDGAVNVTDVTMLISLLINSGEMMDAAQLPEADMNDDGVLNVTDVTSLISSVMSSK